MASPRASSSEVTNLMMMIRTRATNATKEDDCIPFSQDCGRVLFENHDQSSKNYVLIIKFTPCLQTLLQMLESTALGSQNSRLVSESALLLECKQNK